MSNAVNSEALYSERCATLVASLERDREEIRRAVGELQGAAGRAARRLSLRDQIVKHPVAWLAGGLALGLWLGNLTRRRGAR